uniref:TAZ-type domain-containing protein n=1 Tax=Caenorhabditis tropicalis TaxID=1561998 RepID=A0A1I7T486_9PELO
MSTSDDVASAPVPMEQHVPTEAHIQDHMYMLIHAHKCRLQCKENERLAIQNEPPKYAPCTIESCPPTKRVLEHMQTCGPKIDGCKNLPDIHHRQVGFRPDNAVGNWRDQLSPSIRNSNVGQLATRLPPDPDVTNPNSIQYASIMARQIETQVFNTVHSGYAYAIHMDMIIRGPEQDDYPKMWQRHVTNQDRASKIVHVFETLMPQVNEHVEENVAYAKVLENKYFVSSNSYAQYIDEIDQKVGKLLFDRQQQSLQQGNDDQTINNQPTPTPPPSPPFF